MISTRGFYGIGIYNGKQVKNLGTLWRSASILGASFIFTIGTRYKQQSSDTMKSWKHIPLYHYDTFEDFRHSLPKECLLVGVELAETAVPIANFRHPERVAYLLGAEDDGLPETILNHCNHIVQLPGDYCMNVSVAGSIVMYDRIKA